MTYGIGALARIVCDYCHKDVDLRFYMEIRSYIDGRPAADREARAPAAIRTHMCWACATRIGLTKAEILPPIVAIE